MKVAIGKLFRDLLCEAAIFRVRRHSGKGLINRLLPERPELLPEGLHNKFIEAASSFVLSNYKDTRLFAKSSGNSYGRALFPSWLR